MVEVDRMRTRRWKRSGEGGQNEKKEEEVEKEESIVVAKT